MVTDGESYRMREARTRQKGAVTNTIIPRGEDLHLAMGSSGDRNLVVDKLRAELARQAALDEDGEADASSADWTDDDADAAVLSQQD